MASNSRAIDDVIRTFETQFHSHVKALVSEIHQFVNQVKHLREAARPTSTEPSTSIQKPKLSDAHPIFGLTPPATKAQVFIEIVWVVFSNHCTDLTLI